MIKYNDKCSNQVHKASQKFSISFNIVQVIHQTESLKWHLSREDYAILSSWLMHSVLHDIH